MMQLFLNTIFLRHITLSLLIVSLLPTMSTANPVQQQPQPELQQSTPIQPISFRDQILTGIQKFVEAEAAHLYDSDQGTLSHRISGLDPRLRLGVCEDGLEFQPTHPNWLRKRSHLKASCAHPNWSLMVGLELSLYRDVLVARTSVQKNEPLDSMIEFASMDILALHSGYLNSQDSVKGKVAKRNLTMGQVISPHLIKAQVLVPRNGLVEVKAQIGLISVSSQGVALENGAFGDTIKVRNKRSNRVIEAQVVRENLVEVVL